MYYTYIIFFARFLVFLIGLTAAAIFADFLGASASFCFVVRAFLTAADFEIGAPLIFLLLIWRTNGKETSGWACNEINSINSI